MLHPCLIDRDREDRNLALNRISYQVQFGDERVSFFDTSVLVAAFEAVMFNTSPFSSALRRSGKEYIPPVASFACRIYAVLTGPAGQSP